MAYASHLEIQDPGHQQDFLQVLYDSLTLKMGVSHKQKISLSIGKEVISHYVSSVAAILDCKMADT